jgi:hypothetical protein
MMIKFLEKVLFPRHSKWERKKQMKSLVAALTVAVLIAASVAVIMLYENSKR